MADEAILKLETGLKRPVIEIDGETFEILAPEEPSIADSHRMGVLGQELDGLLSKKKLTKEKKERLAKLLRTVSDWIMVGVPPEVRVTLKDAHRIQIIETFTALPLAQTVKKLAEAGGLLGQNAQPDAPGSSEEEPATGTSARPAPSSDTTSS